MSWGRYWMLLSRFLAMAASWRWKCRRRGCPRRFHVRPDAFGGIEVGGAGRQPYHGQPAGVGMDAEELCIAALTWVFQVLPDHNDYGAVQLVAQERG